MNFTRPNELSKIITGSDQDIGGFSTVYFDKEQEERKGGQDDTDSSATTTFGSFHGYLNLDPPLDRPDVLHSGYAMFRTADLPLSPILRQQTFEDWSNLSHLLLTVRGDHRKYFINLQTHSTFITDLYQHRLFLQTPGHWETVIIPLQDFVLTNKGVIQHQVDMDLTKVKSFGVGILDGVFGPYRLDLKEVRCVRGEEIMALGWKNKENNSTKKKNDEPDLFLRG